MRIGSLCSGYGGLEMATQAVVGGSTAWVSDVDKGACKVLAHRFPDAPNLGDMTAVDWTHVEPVDVIAGGTPCQDLSHAGKRAGMTEGTRSNLWVTMREAIATIRPSLVIWENVGGAYSAEADSELESDARLLAGVRRRPGQPVLRALGRVLGDLVSLGYDAGWCGLRAADVGAAHGRLRVFVAAWPADSSRDAWWGGDRDAGTAPNAEGLRPREGRAQSAGLVGRPDAAVGSLLPTPAAERGGRNRSASDGAAVRWSLDYVHKLLPTPTTEPHTGNGHARNLGAEVGLLPTPSVADITGGRKHRSGDRSDELLLNGIAAAQRWGDYAAAIARHEQAFGRQAPEPTETGPRGNPRLSCRFDEWLMGLPAGWITDIPGITHAETLRLCGNGVVPLQAEVAIRTVLGQRQAVAA